MSDEVNVQLKKPLDKMTAKELRQLVIDQIPQITGATGMDKDQLITAIKEVLGITDEAGKVSPYKEQIWALKRQIRELRIKKDETPGEKRAERCAIRRKINHLKKRTRRLALGL